MPNTCGSSSQLGKIQINYQIIYYKYDRKQKRKFNLCCFLFKDIIRVAAHFLLIHNCKVSFLVYLLQKWYRLWRLVQVTYCVVLICSVELGCIFTLLVRRERPDLGSNWEMKKILKKKNHSFFVVVCIGFKKPHFVLQPHRVKHAGITVSDPNPAGIDLNSSFSLSTLRSNLLWV